MNVQGRPPLRQCDSLNPCRWRGKRLHHHGGGVLNLIKPSTAASKMNVQGRPPLGWCDSSNPCHWRGKRLHHHGDGVCWLFVLFVDGLVTSQAHPM